jgi:preprotein translocase subunit SecD
VIGAAVARFIWPLFIVAAAEPIAAQPQSLEVVESRGDADRHTKQPIVTLRLSEASALRFGDLTAANLGRKIELRIEGRTVMAAIVHEPIRGGIVQIIDPDFTGPSAQAVASRIAGGVRVEVEVVGR